MWSLASFPHGRLLLKCRGVYKTFVLLFGLFSSLAFGNHHTAAPQVVADSLEVSPDRFLSFSIEGIMDTQDVLATGGHNLFHQLTLTTPGGLTITPSGGSRNAFSHGYNFSEGLEPNTINYQLDFRADLNSQAIPSNVDLSLKLTWSDFINEKLNSVILALIQKPGDGISDGERPFFTTTVEPITLTDGRGSGDLMLTLQNMNFYDQFFNPVRLNGIGVIANGEPEEVSSGMVRVPIEVFNNELGRTEILTEVTLLTDFGNNLSLEIEISFDIGRDYENRAT